VIVNVVCNNIFIKKSIEQVVICGVVFHSVRVGSHVEVDPVIVLIGGVLIHSVVGRIDEKDSVSTIQARGVVGIVIHSVRIGRGEGDSDSGIKDISTYGGRSVAIHSVVGGIDENDPEVVRIGGVVIHSAKVGREEGDSDKAMVRGIVTHSDRVGTFEVDSKYKTLDSTVLNGNT
jgi:hypothetical protein